jgi:Uma2 family endonuclease
MAGSHLTGAVELVVEIISPATANERRDREIKLALYSERGVDEYWLVDWQQQTVLVYRRQGDALQAVETLGRDDTLTAAVLPGFAVPVARLFDR